MSSSLLVGVSVGDASWCRPAVAGILFSCAFLSLSRRSFFVVRSHSGEWLGRCPFLGPNTCAFLMVTFHGEHISLLFVEEVVSTTAGFRLQTELCCLSGYALVKSILGFSSRIYVRFQ